MSIFGRCMGGGRRTALRNNAPLVARITTLGGSHSALVVDVSSTGVRLRGTGLPKMGELLDIGIDRVRSFGSVAWSENEECGVCFDEALSPSDEQVLKDRIATARGLSPEVKAAFDNWVMGCGR